MVCVCLHILSGHFYVWSFCFFRQPRISGGLWVLDPDVRVGIYMWELMRDGKPKLFSNGTIDQSVPRTTWFWSDLDLTMVRVCGTNFAATNSKFDSFEPVDFSGPALRCSLLSLTILKVCMAGIFRRSLTLGMALLLGCASCRSIVQCPM